MLPYGFGIDFRDIQQSEICHGYNSGSGIAIWFAESPELTDEYIVETREMSQHSFCRKIDAFIFIDKTAYERPFAHFRLEVALYEQNVELIGNNREDYAIYCYVEAA